VSEVTASPAEEFGRSMSRRFIQVAALLIGGAIVAVEILGVRILAPYLGTSHFVWTAQILVTLLALAAGARLGGSWATERDSRARLFWLLLFAAFWIGAGIGLTEPLARIGLNMRVAMGSLMVSLALYFPPLMALAACVPILIRESTSTLGHAGRAAGGVFALNSLGGALTAILVASGMATGLANAAVLSAVVCLLFAFALAWSLVVEGGRVENAGILFFVVMVGLLVTYGGTKRILAFDSKQAQELARVDSPYGMLQVVQYRENGHRELLNDGLIQNSYDPARGQSVDLFVVMLHGLARAYADRIDRALCIGMGAGFVPAKFAEEGTSVQVVEINAAVPPLAKAHFGFKAPGVEITIADGRQFLNDGEGSYDAVILDVFLGDSSPSHLLTKEAFESMRQSLEPQGVLVINCFAEFELGSDFFASSLQLTLQHVFRSVVAHSDGAGALFFVASDRTNLRPVRAIEFLAAHPDLVAAANIAFTNVVNPARLNGVLLTDDFNPIEFYDARIREGIRRDFALGAP
jgi:spermidine synthase